MSVAGQVGMVHSWECPELSGAMGQRWVCGGIWQSADSHIAAALRKAYVEAGLWGKFVLSFLWCFWRWSFLDHSNLAQIAAVQPVLWSVQVWMAWTKPSPHPEADVSLARVEIECRRHVLFDEDWLGTFACNGHLLDPVSESFFRPVWGNRIMFRSRLLCEGLISSGKLVRPVWPLWLAAPGISTEVQRQLWAVAPGSSGFRFSYVMTMHVFPFKLCLIVSLPKQSSSFFVFQQSKYQDLSQNPGAKRGRAADQSLPTFTTNSGLLYHGCSMICF